MEQDIPAVPAAEPQKSSQGWVSDADSLFNRQEYSAACGVYKKGLGPAPDNPDAMHKLGLCFIHMNKPWDALRIYDKIVGINGSFKFDPAYAQAFDVQAKRLLQMKKFRDALDAAATAQKVDPGYCIPAQFSEAWNNIGLDLLQNGDYPGALDACDKASELDPGFIVNPRYLVAFRHTGRCNPPDGGDTDVSGAHLPGESPGPGPSISPADPPITRTVREKPVLSPFRVPDKTRTPGYISYNLPPSDCQSEYRYGIRVDPEEEGRIAEYFENLRKPGRVIEQPPYITDRNPDSKPPGEKTSSSASGITPGPGTVMRDEAVFSDYRIAYQAWMQHLAEDDEGRVLPVIQSHDDRQPVPLQNAGKSWTSKDDDRLKRMFISGIPVTALCSIFQRTRGAITSRLIKFNLITDTETKNTFITQNPEPVQPVRIEAKVRTEPAPMIRCILFDLDQTLVDSAHLKAYRDAGRWNQVMALIPRLKENPPIDSMLAELRQQGLKLGCVTSSPRGYASEIIRHFGWQFDCVVTYQDTGRHKPDPQPFERALVDLQLSPGECIAVGDSEPDRTAANAAGIRPVTVNWFDEDGTEQPGTGIISRPDQFRAYCSSAEFFGHESEKPVLVAAEKPHEYPVAVPADLFFTDPRKDEEWKKGHILFLTPYYALQLKNHHLNPRHDGPSSRILNLKNIDKRNEKRQQSGSVYQLSKMDLGRIQEYAKEIRGLFLEDSNLTVCVMPKSSNAREPSGIRRVAEALCCGRWQDGTKVIERKVERATKHLGGDRSYDNELASLGITDSLQVRDRIVFLLDDITTTGNSLKAGRSLLLSHGAREVIMFALGKTSD